MKTIIDAVNELKGLWRDSSMTTLWSIDDRVKLMYGDSITERTVCTRTEFEKCVEEMSKGEFVPQAIKKPVLVTVNGMQYEVGKLYEFSDTKDHTYPCVEALASIDVNENLPFKSVRTSYMYCREVKSSLGKITPAPVDLVDGKAYSFEYINEDMLGRYHKGSNRFIIGNSNAKASKVKNIVPLVPEVK